jgi:hypothetical protein
LGGDTIKSTIRHNTCIHNGRSPRLARRQGAIYLSTWHGGKLNGVEIEDNIVVWDPPLDAPAFHATAEFTGDLPNRMTSNTILAVSGSFTSSKTGIKFAGNRYCASHATFVPMAPESDPAAKESLELCGCLREWLARSSGAESRTVATADSSSAPELVTNPSLQTGGWVLLGTLEPDGTEIETSRGQLVLMESMMHQFSNLGLSGIVVPARVMSADQIEAWKIDWNFDPKLRIEAPQDEKLRKPFVPTNANQLLLISPSKEVVARWSYPVSPAEVWLQLQSRLGTPVGMQQMPACTRVQAR